MANLGSDDTPITGESFGLPSGWSLTENAAGEVVIEDNGGNVVFRRDETAGEWVTDSIDAESVSTDALEAANVKHDGEVSDSLTNPTVIRLLTNDLFSQIENSYSVSEITADNSPVEIHQDSIRHALLVAIGYELGSGAAKDFVDVLAISRSGREITTVGEASDANIARSYSEGEDAVEIAIDEDSETYNVAVWVVAGDLVP